MGILDRLANRRGLKELAAAPYPTETPSGVISQGIEANTLRQLPYAVLEDPERAKVLKLAEDPKILAQLPKSKVIHDVQPKIHLPSPEELKKILDPKRYPVDKE